jgi:hypothetical protein
MCGGRGRGSLWAFGMSWDLVGYWAHLLLWLWPISLFFLFFSNLFVSMVSALPALPPRLKRLDDKSVIGRYGLA